MADINQFAQIPSGPEPADVPLKKKKKKSHKVLWTILIIILILLIALGVFFFVTISGIENKPSDPNQYPAYLPPDVPDIAQFNQAGVTNILILGSDSRGGSDSGRSDVTMLMSVNAGKGTISLVSILRDTYVDVPGYESKKKINAAFQFGGGDLVARTIENNFRIKIDGWFATDFSNFELLVNDIGGIDLEITQKEANVINRISGSSSTVSAGNAHLDGAQALTYSRDRSDIQSDWGRTSRQRKVITAIMSKFRSLDPVSMYDAVTFYLPFVSTNMTDLQLAGLTVTGLFASGYETKETMLPLSGEYTEKNYNLYPKYDIVIPRLHSFLADPRSHDDTN